METADIPGDTTCSSLLRDLQHIWDEVGEDDLERDKMLLQLEQECLEVYRKKVYQASQMRTQLHQSIADAEGEIALLLSTLEDRGLFSRDDNRGASLKEQLVMLHPLLKELRDRKEDRIKQFTAVKGDIQKIFMEISGLSDGGSAADFLLSVDEDLSLKRLEEYHVHLQALQKEKEGRLQKVSDYLSVIHQFCSVLAMDPMKVLSEVSSSLGKDIATKSDSISDFTLDGLKHTVEFLGSEKTKRLRKLQEFATTLIELWNLMDCSDDEKNTYDHIIQASGKTEAEVTSCGALSPDYIDQAEREVLRLEKLKVTKVKEIVLKKQAELCDIFREGHMEPDLKASRERILSIIDSGSFNSSELLGSLDRQIVDAKEEALSRKEIMEKIDKWVTACEEETWLDEYNRDENRYSGSRGAHINLKRAEKARNTIQKLPSMLESLIQKIKAWEEENNRSFLYDGVHMLSALEDQNVARREKDQEKKRIRDQKKLQEQMAAEQEVWFGARPSPHKPASAKKGLSVRTNGNVTPSRRVSLAGTLLQGDAPRKKDSGATPVRSGKDGKEKARPSAPANFVAIAKEDSKVA